MKSIEIVTETISRLGRLPACVSVQVVSKQYIENVAFGCFEYSDTGATITIAGLFPQDLGVTEEEWLESLKETTCHEWVHMEQWRDGKAINHRGLDRRVRYLLKKIGE